MSTNWIIPGSPGGLVTNQLLKLNLDLIAASISGLTGNYVTLDTTQTITAIKSFKSSGTGPLLYIDPTTVNGFGDPGRVGFGTASPSFKYHFYADGDPLLYQLTYVGDYFDTGSTLPKGYLGPLANNIWWDKTSGGVRQAAAAGDAGFLGTIIFNTDAGGGVVSHQEVAEIGVVVVDPADSTRTARMQFELNSNGHSFQTVIDKYMGGAVMTLDPILNNGATLKVGPGESIVSTAPINGGAYISSDDYSNAAYTAGCQPMGAGVYRARGGTHATIFDMHVKATDTARLAIDSGLTNSNTFTPTDRLLVDPTSGLQAQGTTTNNSAAAGWIGEVLTASAVRSSPVTLSSGVSADVCSKSLTAGDWDVWCGIGFTSGGTTTKLEYGLSKTTATLPATDTTAVPTAGEVRGSLPVSIAADDATGSLYARVSLASPATVYLVANATFGAGSASAFGSINARRAR